MKKVAFLFACAFCLAFSAKATESTPRGTLLELHSCELYAGGCIVSSEATQGGRYMVRAWNLAGGSFAGTDLAGLQVAVLQTASDNLAARGTSPGHSVIYLPEGATVAQQRALTGWLKAQLPELGESTCRVAPMQFEWVRSSCRFQAGNFVSVQAVSLESCPTGGCGEALWYAPRTENSVFTVAVNQASKVAEPELKLRWEDAGKKSVFLGRFGEPGPLKSVYVTLADLCGSAGRVL